jgi:hypothetical protein
MARNLEGHESSLDTLQSFSLHELSQLTRKNPEDLEHSIMYAADVFWVKKLHFQ